MSKQYDAIIIGGGHNGLVAASYLAKAGYKPLVLERRPFVGGCAVTEELIPGFKFNTGAMVLGSLHPQVSADLQLSKFGLEELPIDPQVFTPFPDGKHLLMWLDVKKTQKEIAKFSKKDAQMYPEYLDFWSNMAQMIEPTVLAPPLSLSEMAGFFEGGEAEAALKKMLMSVKDFLDEYFESDQVKASLGWGAIDSVNGGPYSPGTAWVLGVHHFTWSQFTAVKGGMGAATQAMARAAEYFGATIQTDADVNKILIKDGKVEGVKLETGKIIKGRIVVSNADAKRTYLKLVGSDNLEKRIVRSVKSIKARAVGMSVHCALEELPDFKALPGTKKGPQHNILLIAPSLEYVEKAWDDAKYGKPSREPTMYSPMQSSLDPSYAPPGKHTMSMWVQYAPYDLKNGEWDTVKEEFKEVAIDKVTEYAPNFRKSIIDSVAISPRDLENRFNITEGHCYHSEMTIHQMLGNRPIPEYSRYSTPIQGLYLASASTHPGGGVTGIPAYNACNVILNDIEEKKI